MSAFAAIVYGLDQQALATISPDVWPVALLVTAAIIVIVRRALK